jgi:CHU_C Type IX secretion signal domain
MMRRLLFLLFFTAFAGPAFADHLIGTDWQMQSLGGGRFQVRLTLYTDPGAGNPNALGDPTVTLASYERGGSGSDRLVEVFTISRISSGLLAGGSPACAFANRPIRAIGYEATLTLAPSQYTSANGYYLAWERCCRNQLVTNLSSAQSTGLVAVLRFPAVATANQLPNSAPQLVAAPPSVALCVDEATELNLAATDADGDSLAYALVAPLAGNTSQAAPIISVPNPAPYLPVRYVMGFSATQPLIGTVALDARTGTLRCRPTQPGTYALAVQVSEYRARRKIGENRRDFELTVANCPANAAPTLTRVTPPDTVLITGGADRCLAVFATDADSGQTLTVRALDGTSVAISPTSFLVTDTAAPQEVQVCWLDCAQPSRSRLTLIVTDDGCRASRPDTLRIPVRIVPAPNLAPRIQLLPAPPTAPLTVMAGQEISFEVAVSDPDAGARDLFTLALNVSGSAALSGALRADPPTGTSPFRTTVRWTPPCTAARAPDAAPYRIQLQVIDGGCRPLTDTASVAVRVLTAGSSGVVELPNILTPMAHPDGLNDCFSLPPGAARSSDEPCGEAFSAVRIFNRWGREVFFSADPTFCWDAAGLSAGTYFYQLQWASRRQRGLLTVIR